MLEILQFLSLMTKNKNKSINDKNIRADQFGYDMDVDHQSLITQKEDDEINRQIEQANKERRELNERLKKEERKYDHLVRACHENEIPLIVRFSEQDAEARKKFWDEKEIERIQNLKEEMKIQAENKERLLRMSADKDSFFNNIQEARRADFEKKMEEFKVVFFGECLMLFDVTKKYQKTFISFIYQKIFIYFL